MDKILFFLTLVTALGSGLIAGVFFIFSTTVMRAFGRLPANEGIAAMNMINVVIINPMFLGVFLGTAVVCLALTVMSLIRWQQPGNAWLLAGALLYLIGSIAVTMIFNVPMNNALAAVTPVNADGIWTNYLSTWTFWNHVRTIASLAAAASFIAALSFR
jgi:uncharacterized membrane protein